MIPAFDWITTHVPFLGLMAQHPPSSNRPLLTRLTEQLIVGLISAAGVLYTDNIRHDDEIKQITQEVREAKRVIDEMRRDLYVPRISSNEAKENHHGKN